MDNVKEKLDALSRASAGGGDFWHTKFRTDLVYHYRRGDLVTREELKAAVEAERERCAKICDGVADDFWDSECGPAQCAEAIRARGET